MAKYLLVLFKKLLIQMDICLNNSEEMLLLLKAMEMCEGKRLLSK
ncbi:hypothetical protein [Virgibacillus pantothenticus]|nr:hypothetical protein [Virgibacillus pantothenticus]